MAMIKNKMTFIYIPPLHGHYSHILFPASEISHFDLTRESRLVDPSPGKLQNRRRGKRE